MAEVTEAPNESFPKKRRTPSMATYQGVDHVPKPLRLQTAILLGA